MRLPLWVFGLLALFSLPLTSCQSSSAGTESSHGAEGKSVLAYLSAEGDPSIREALQREARDAAKSEGFELITRVVSAPEQLLAGLDEVAAEGAKGVLVGTTDPRLGPAIRQKAQQYGLKLIAVEERMLDEEGQALAETPFIGVNAPKLGKLAAEALIAGMKDREWQPGQASLIIVVRNTHPTTRGKTDAIIEELAKVGVPETKMFRVVVEQEDEAAASLAAEKLLPRIGRSKRWLVTGPNDATVLATLEALKKSGVKPDEVIGVGIGGARSQPEFGFVASVPIPTKAMGHQAVEALVKWVKDGVAPAKETLLEGNLADQ